MSYDGVNVLGVFCKVAPAGRLDGWTTGWLGDWTAGRQDGWTRVPAKPLAGFIHAIWPERRSL